MDKMEEFKKSISREKNKEMEDKFQEISEKLEGLINTNSVENIFEISSEFDKIIEKEQTTTLESQLFIYSKAYEGFKAAAYSYFGNSRQTSNH